MDPIPQLLINLVLRYEPNAIKKNTFQYVKYFIHLMEGYLSFTLGKHGFMILDKDGDLFPYVKFIDFLQLDLKEMFDKFRNNKNPQMSKSQWDEGGKDLYDKVVDVIPDYQSNTTSKNLKGNPTYRPAPRPPRLAENPRHYLWNSLGTNYIKSFIDDNIRKQKDIIIKEYIKEIENHTNTDCRSFSTCEEYGCNSSHLEDNWNSVAWRGYGLETELCSPASSHFLWRAVETEDRSLERITGDIKEIESKCKQEIDRMISSINFHPDKIHYINHYMDDILFNGESEIDNTISQGTYKNGYVRKITGGLEGEFNYKFNKQENIRKFLKEIEMYLK